MAAVEKLYSVKAIDIDQTEGYVDVGGKKYHRNVELNIIINDSARMSKLLNLTMTADKAEEIAKVLLKGAKRTRKLEKRDLKRK